MDGERERDRERQETERSPLLLMDISFQDRGAQSNPQGLTGPKRPPKFVTKLLICHVPEEENVLIHDQRDITITFNSNWM